MIQRRRRMVMPLVAAALILAACGCGGGGLPVHLLRLTPESLQNRALQTRQFEGISEAGLFSAATGVVQDLGFIIDESETSLGLIVGSKKRDAPADATQRLVQVFGTAAWWIGAAMIAALGADPDIGVIPVDDYQKLWVSICIRPESESDETTHNVRVTFQRIVWNTDDEIARNQSLDEPEFYQKFFDLLSKSAFLEWQEK